MQVSGSFTIPAPRQRVWEALNDPEILRQCISGCEELNRTGANEFEGKVVAKVGPVKATFAGKVTLADLDPPNGYTLQGEGKGGVAGFAKGSAKVKLRDEGAGTVLDYTADASVGGKIAQIGGRLIEATVNQTAADFFAKFSALVAANAPAANESAPAAPVPTTPARSAKPFWQHSGTWIVVGIIAVAVILILISR